MRWVLLVFLWLCGSAVLFWICLCALNILMLLFIYHSTTQSSIFIINFRYICS